MQTCSLQHKVVHWAPLVGITSVPKLHLGCELRSYVIILTPLEGISKETRTNLAALSLDMSTCAAHRQKLHSHSITWLHAIVNQRGQFEHDKHYLEHRIKENPKR